MNAEGGCAPCGKGGELFSVLPRENRLRNESRHEPFCSGVLYFMFIIFSAVSTSLLYPPGSYAAGPPAPDRPVEDQVHAKRIEGMIGFPGVPEESPEDPGYSSMLLFDSRSGQPPSIAGGQAGNLYDQSCRFPGTHPIPDGSRFTAWLGHGDQAEAPEGKIFRQGQPQ